MPDNPKNGAETPEETSAPSAAPSTPDAEAATAASAEVSLEQLKAIIGALQDDLETLKSENLRLVADMQNLRRRTDKEREDTAKYAISKFAQDIVGVVDNFERAASAVPAEAAEKDQVLKSFLDGVILAEREFLSVLERHGVKRIAAQGQPFNPHHHQAVMEREDGSVPAGTVLQVFQAGFMIEERCLRPAMVVVATGGAKAAKAAETPSPEPENNGGETDNG
jgi:molecular chaperone GrpE